jgi:hypothetical protein
MIVIPLRAAEGIDWALRQESFNPYHHPGVVTALRSAGYHDTAEWIDANHLTYIQGVTQGFIVNLGIEEHDDLTANT